MTAIPFSALRSLQLEGRSHPAEGAWPLTVRRIECGEGMPFPDTAAEWDESGPLPPLPDVSASVRVNSRMYRRARTVDDCRRRLGRHPGSSPEHELDEVVACVRLFASWPTGPTGSVPLVGDEGQVLAATHCVVLKDASSEFLFDGMFGPSWGDRGFAAMPFAYFERHSFDAWVTDWDEHLRFERDIVAERTPGGVAKRWVIRDEADRRVYGFEAWDTSGREKLGWAFVVETGGGLDVEELYVRPEFRRRGLASALAGRVRHLADAKKLPLRLWVSFADSRRESPATQDGLVAIAAKLGVRFRACPERWAAYLATDEPGGAAEPVEPAAMPPRPTAGIAALYGAVMAARTASNGVNGHVPPRPVETWTRYTPFPEVDSPEWGVMNRRRGELIEKRHTVGLDEEECAEFEYLQQESRRAVRARHPAPPLPPVSLEAMKAYLAAKEIGG